MSEHAILELVILEIILELVILNYLSLLHTFLKFWTHSHTT